MEKKVITIWERSKKKEDGSWQWEHNHISDGFAEKLDSPKAVSAEQKKSWKGAKWRGLKAYLIDGKVEQAN